MDKKLIIALLLVLILIFTSCDRLKRPGEPEERPPEEIYTGTRGLVMNFVRDLPPAKIYDTTTLALIAELRNKGTSDITNCMLHLSGFDDSIVRIQRKEQPCGELDGKSPLNPEGGFNTAEFTASTIELPEGTDSYKPKFVLTACYDYETIANPVVCIDPNLYSIQAVEQACTVQDVSMMGGQGAPVSVSRVDVDMMKEKVLFKIHVTNSAGGRVFRTGLSKRGFGAHTCPFNLEYDDLNIVDYNIDMRGGSLIKCSPQLNNAPRVRLVENKATIFCTFDIRGDYAFTTPLNIRLGYGYMESISKDVEILKTPE